MIRDLLITDTFIHLNKNGDGFLGESGKESVIHPLAETYSSCICVHPNDRYNSDIYIFNCFMRILWLTYSEITPSQRQSVWYHLKTFAHHKRNITFSNTTFLIL